MATIDNAALTKNQQLIAALIAGKPFIVSDNPPGITSSSPNSPLSPNGGDYTVSMFNGMLKFNSSQGMLNFLAAMDTAISNWDATTDPELSGIPSEKPLAGDPTKNAFDSSMGFNSIRRKYEQTFYDNNNFKDTIPIYIKSEDLKTVLNDNLEVEFGTTIHKYISPNIVAKIANEDITMLDWHRANPGIGLKNPNVTYWNTVTGEQLTSPNTILPVGCTLEFLVTTPVVEIDANDYRKIKVTVLPVMQNANGNVACGYNYTYTWGDGTQTPNPPGFYGFPFASHIYNINLQPGQSQSFTITCSATAFGCQDNTCNSLTVSKTAIVTLSVPTGGCTQSTHEQPEVTKMFTYGGINYRIVGVAGAQEDDQFWPRRNMIWSRTYWQKQRGSSWIPTKNKKVSLGARIYNGIYFGCSTYEYRDRQTFHFNQQHVTVNDNIGKRYGYIYSLPGSIVNSLKSDHFVNIKQPDGTYFTESIIGNSLFQ